MAILSMFYGIIISMFYDDNKQHHTPHIHVKYQGDKATFSIPDGELMSGTLKKPQLRLVQAWIALHSAELMADWELATSGQNVYPIEPLK